MSAKNFFLLQQILHYLIVLHLLEFFEQLDHEFKDIFVKRLESCSNEAPSPSSGVFRAVAFLQALAWPVLSHRPQSHYSRLLGDLNVLPMNILQRSVLRWERHRVVSGGCQSRNPSPNIWIS